MRSTRSSTAGPNKVAEITGRSRRSSATRDVPKLKERRNKSAVDADASAFMDDRKQILVFSDAGGTGQDFRRPRQNQRKRVHYLVQPGWRADAAVQGFGRTHRSNQKQAPHYVLVTTNLKGHLRFVSSIARVGWISSAPDKGAATDWKPGHIHGGHNLETAVFRRSAHNYVKSLRSQTDQTVGVSGYLRRNHGPQGEGQRGNITVSTIPTIGRFLNRLLSLEVGLQNERYSMGSSRRCRRLWTTTSRRAISILESRISRPSRSRSLMSRWHIPMRHRGTDHLTSP